MNYRGDVDFVLFVEKVCSTCYAIEMGWNVDFSFCCMVLRVFILCFLVVCFVCVMKLNMYVVVDVIKDVDDEVVIVELKNY